MDSRKLEMLLTTMRTGSFSKAAAELCCTQSAVTQAMNSLEGELGCKVLERDHRGVRLTAAGEELYSDIVSAEMNMRQLVDHAAQIAGARTLPLRIGVFSSISTTWLPPLLRTYKLLHPEVFFDIRVGTDSIVQWLSHGEIDVALGDDARCRTVRFMPLQDDPYCAVLPEGTVDKGRKRIAQDELAQLPFLMAPMNALDRHLSVIPHNRTNVNCDDDSTLLSMIEQGLGATVMPALCLTGRKARVHVLELEPSAKRILGVALPKAPTRAASLFASFLVDEFSYQSPIAT